MTETSEVTTLNRYTKIRPNHHTVNSLKRPTDIQAMNLIKTIDHLYSHGWCFAKVAIILLIYLMVLLAILPIHCDIICPRDTSNIYPCSCNNGTRGLLIKCSRTNLAILSNTFKNLNNDNVEQIEIEDSSISRLFGVIFSDPQTYKFHSTIKELDVRGSNLKHIDSNSFSDELKTNLQYFILDRNQLTQVPIDLVNNMTNLKLLNFSSNLLTSIESNSFAKLVNLTDLDLSTNKINKLTKSSFNSLFNLEYLNLNNNDINKLEKNLFAFGRKLKYLDLSNNKLTNLDRQDFNDLTALETLRLSNNQLTTIPRSIFSRNGKLYNLDMSLNKLDDIDTYLFKSVRFLRDLNMSGNSIKEITKNTFSPTTRIKRIDLSGNLLQGLAPETFKNLEWLEKIDLSHNQIVNISNDAFSKIYSVEIDLSHNKLTRIFYYAFHEVSNITKLDLSHNNIDDGISLIAFEQSDCAHFDLSYNQIQDISRIPISNFTGVRILDLSHNQITEFNKKSFTQKVPLYELHTIDASFNNISQISGNVLERLKSIRFLNISHNSLRRLTSGGLGNSPTLLELDLSFNNLVDVGAGTLSGLVSMKNLDISHNRLKKMIPVPVALNSIHLEHNEIAQLSKSAFPSLNSLLELYLEHNRISNIEEGTFSTLLALHTLSLGYNNLSSVPAHALKDLTSLQSLRLEGNNIQRLARRAFGTLPIVFHLFLEHNNISTVSDHAFDGMLQLLHLNLSHNNLLELPPEAFSGLVSLRSLDLSNNQLSRFENKTRSAMEDLLSLEEANMSYNKLSTITAKTFLSSPYIPYKLTKLDLSHNLIGILVNNFANGFKRVEWLSLRGNIINEIYANVLGNATHLRHLDLSHNKLKSLKDGTLNGQFPNLTTILLNNNKLTTINPREFDKLKTLTTLDLSNNRLETFHSESIRWVKRGMFLDYRNNQLDCGCNLLPLVAWVDSIKARSQYYPLVNANHNLVMSNTALKSKLNSANLKPQHVQASQLISGINCSKPEILSGKSIMQLMDVAPTNEINCSPVYLDEADSMKRLKAPIQYTGAEPYFLEGEQDLKIGWTLTESHMDILNFIVFRAEFQQEFSLSAYRTTRKRSSDDAPSYHLIGHKVERVPYHERTLIMRGLDASKYNVICITYESNENLINNMIDLFNSSLSVLSNQMVKILADYNQINCADINTLLRRDTSERLVSSANSPTLSLLIIIPILIYITGAFTFDRYQH